jgi:hypothetical protein
VNMSVVGVRQMNLIAGISQSGFVEARLCQLRGKGIGQVGPRVTRRPHVAGLNIEMGRYFEIGDWLGRGVQYLV